MCVQCCSDKSCCLPGPIWNKDLSVCKTCSAALGNEFAAQLNLGAILC